VASGPLQGLGERLRMAILARAVYPLHGHGGLERHVADLVRHLIARDIAVLISA
jgi:glycogen(starch) synthase